jgi:signal transduction histidine kinase
VRDADTFSRLLSLTSHELRSPLGVIRGYLKWLEQQGDTLPEQHRQVVDATVKATDRLAGLLSELSVLAQLQRRETAVARDPIPLDALAADLAAAFGAQRRPVTLSITDLPAVALAGDRPLLHGALDALATAVSLARPRDQTIILGARRESSDPPTLRLELTPPDPGPDRQEVPINLTRGGLGFRLAMAAEIIDAHGGRVAEQQSAGRLVGVVVWLPVVEA